MNKAQRYSYQVHVMHTYIPGASKFGKVVSIIKHIDISGAFDEVTSCKV